MADNIRPRAFLVDDEGRTVRFDALTVFKEKIAVAVSVHPFEDAINRTDHLSRKNDRWSLAGEFTDHELEGRDPETGERSEAEASRTSIAARRTLLREWAGTQILIFRGHQFDLLSVTLANVDFNFTGSALGVTMTLQEVRISSTVLIEVTLPRPVRKRKSKGRVKTKVETKTEEISDRKSWAKSIFG